MAIIQENIGNDLVRTYSNKGMKIHGGSPEADYDEAIDPVSLGRVYTETDIPIDDEEKSEEELLREKAEAFDLLIGE